MDGQDDEQVPCYGDQVYDEEEDEEWLLVLRSGGESQEDELRVRGAGSALSVWGP